MNKVKKIIWLSIIFLADLILVYFFNPGYLTAILLIIGLPALVNFYLLKNARKKILLFSLTATILFAPALELVSRLANAWDVQSIFWRPFDLIPLENMIFAFLNFFFGLGLYEYFVKNDRQFKISKRFNYLIGMYLFFSILIFGIYFYNPIYVTWPYYYLGIMLFLAMIILSILQPTKIKSVIFPTIYLGIIFFLFELVALKLGYWWWPGEYLWPLNFGEQIFPIDDVVIWYLLSTPTLILGYEYFMIADKQIDTKV